MKILHLNHATISELSGHDGFPAVSFYMPIHSAQREEVGQDKIRLKNLTQRAEQQLKAKNYHFKRSSILDEVRTFQEQHEFWKTPGDGIAIFVSPDSQKAVILPESVDEAVHVGGQFLLSPLLGMLMQNKEFYVAAISQKSNYLFHGDKFSLDELEDVDLPGPMEEELGIEDYQNEKQHHAIKAGSASFHGHGGSDDGIDAMRENYFRMVAKMIDARLKGVANDPLILAGVEKDIAYYRKIASYNNITEEFIPGNFENVNRGDLHQKALNIVKELDENRKQTEIETYNMMENKDPEKAATDPKEILDAATHGRVGKLFVAFGEQTKDSVKKGQEAIARYFADASQEGKQIDKAVVEAWKNGGDIIPVNPDVLNKSSRIAALYRF